MIGVDTGFFFALRESHPLAAKVFQEEDLAVSVLTQFELRRISLRQGIPWKDIGGPLTRSATVLDITAEAADAAARIAQGTGMPALDALILASLAAAGCRKVCTRDAHFAKYRGKDIEIILLA
ncbi:MAG: PIN domain-containing protein [Candidatus Aminicenantes bacterium]|nr:PIN domain-containing protein [Candidatus Aminicenantes bacterium]